MVNLKTKSAGDGYRRNAIEKTVLRFLGVRTFSHGLDPKRSLVLLVGIGRRCAGEAVRNDSDASAELETAPLAALPQPRAKQHADHGQEARETAVNPSAQALPGSQKLVYPMDSKPLLTRIH